MIIPEGTISWAIEVLAREEYLDNKIVHGFGTPRSSTFTQLPLSATNNQIARFVIQASTPDSGCSPIQVFMMSINNFSGTMYLEPKIIHAEREKIQAFFVVSASTNVMIGSSTDYLMAMYLPSAIKCISSTQGRIWPLGYTDALSPTVDSFASQVAESAFRAGDDLSSGITAHQSFAIEKYGAMCMTSSLCYCGLVLPFKRGNFGFHYLAGGKQFFKFTVASFDDGLNTVPLASSGTESTLKTFNFGIFGSTYLNSNRI